MQIKTRQTDGLDCKHLSFDMGIESPSEIPDSFFEDREKYGFGIECPECGHWFKPIYDEPTDTLFLLDKKATDLFVKGLVDDINRSNK